MLEIFIPEKVNKKLTINTFSKEQQDVLMESFEWLEVFDISYPFLEWTFLQLPYFDQDLLVYANGMFGKTFFYEYDVLEHTAYSTGISFYTWEQFLSELQSISGNIENIMKDIQSNKLLTNSKKDEIREKIETTFFTISGVYFSLAQLLYKTERNIWKLEDIGEGIEYQAQWELLKETSTTKQVELEAQLKKLEGKAQLFFDAIAHIF